MGKKKLKSKKKVTGKAAKPNVTVVLKYALAIVVAVGIAFFCLQLTDISSSVQDAERLKQKGYTHLKKRRIRAAHRSFDKALEIAKKNDFVNRKPLVLADILTGKADAYGTAAIIKGLYHDNAPKAIDFFWQAYRINKEMYVLNGIAQLYSNLGNYKEHAKVSQQILDILLAHPQKVSRLTQGNGDAEVVSGTLRPLLSNCMISLRKIGNADLAATYFWKMKHVFPQHITWKETYQTPTDYIAELVNDQPWWDAPQWDGTGDWRRKVEMHYKDILGELKRFLAKNGQFTLNQDHDLVGKRAGNKQVVKDWSEVLLWDTDFTENCHAFPITCSLVRGITQITGLDETGHAVMGQVTILKLRPGSHLVPHVGTSNMRLTNHLGLIIPKGVSLRVANETRGWTQGKVIVFDDSFEHEVWHNGTKDRYVLYMSSWKKEFGWMAPSKAAKFW